MVVVNLIISQKTLNDVYYECNLLKREDHTEMEWLIAKQAEGLLELLAHNISEEKLSIERIEEKTNAVR